MFAGAVLAAVVTGIVVNALALQRGHHPAPFFGRSFSVPDDAPSAAAGVAVPIPAPRPAAAVARAHPPAAAAAPAETARVAGAPDPHRRSDQGR